MTAGAPWSVKGINPKAREVAKHHARRSGMTLGEWLNRVILEDDGASEAASEAIAGSGGEELGRIAHALDRLTDRLQAAETRTGLAVSGVEHSVRQALARIETAEREGLAVAARVDSAVERVGGEQSRLAERLRRFETEAAGPRSGEALRAIEQSVTRLAGQIYEADGRTREGVAALEARLALAETRLADPATFMDDVVQRLGERLAQAESHTSEAIETLRRSLAALDGRLEALEGGRSADDGRFEMLAQTLAGQVEAVRAEISERLAGVDGGRVDRRFAELDQQVKAAEQRSARAVQQMGRDVLAMAEAVNRRMQSSEDRHAEAMTKAGEEMSRIAGALEARLGRAEQAQTEALERLSGELGKITDRLSERLLVSDRRAAEAIDDVGEQVARVTERMAQSQERASQDLAEKIRESEARTAQLLEETRARLERRLGESPAGALRQGESPAVEAEPPAPAALAPEPDLAEPPAGTVLATFERPAVYAPPVLSVSPWPAVASAPMPAAAAFGPELFSRAEDLEALDDEVEELELTETAAPFIPPRPSRVAEFAPIPEPEGDLFDLDQPEPPAFDESALSTRDVIEQARAAARSAAPEGDERSKVQARLSWRATRPGRFGAMLFGARPKRLPSSTLQTALLVAGGAAFLSVGAAGVVLMQGPPDRPAGDVGVGAPRAAVALTPPAVSALPAEGAAGPRPPAQLADALQTAFAKAVDGLAAGQPGALAKIKAIAEAGHPPAQFYLGKLYESGEHGVKQSWAEARRWTERAAEGGDPGAMHNLALFDFRGEGGAQDLAAAARWFRAAAELGVVDSQYNLGLLYQSGSGVQRDLGLAYAWFSIAASRGDVQARSNAERLRSQLTPEQRAAADDAIGAFAARSSSPARNFAAAGPPTVSVVAAQRILGRLGYFKGGADGAASPALSAAVSAYQRDQQMPATGQLDPATAQRLAAFGQ